jgi:hypothetical protein
MKLVALVCASLCVALPSFALGVSEYTPVIQGGTVNSDLPPVRFQGNNLSIVVFTDQDGIHENCGKPEKGFVMIACRRQLQDSGANVLFMPNPCPMGGREFYAKIACHELGHVNGWTGDHEL